MFRLIALLLLLLPLPGAAQAPSPHAIDIPAWFIETFFDFRDDVKEAAASGRRVMIYFGQDGCPYCKLMLESNFSQKQITDKTRKGIFPIALNMWGDRPTTWTDGRQRSEKELAAFLKVQYTPTLLFLDEKGEVIVRLNGYYQPHRLDAALDFVIGKLERKQAFGEYMRTAVKESAASQLADQPFFLRGNDLSRKAAGKPLAVLFETRFCAGCDELHKEGFQRAEVRSLIPRLDIARFALSEKTPMVTPDGRKTDAESFARELKIVYTPSVVFFDAGGREVFRIEAYLRPFHLASGMEYVASGAYREQPSFQRYIQTRADRMRSRGEKVELWK